MKEASLSATRPTMRDVAEQAGVSLKTVSRVINAEAGVAPATAERVGEAIAALGFQRNDLARSLRHGLSSSTLGLVIEDVANPFYSTVAQAVETAARERGFLLITASAREDAERERELVGALVGRRVDALLIVPAGPDQSYAETMRGRTAFVYVDRPPGGLDADTRAARRRRRRARGGRAPARPRPPPDRVRRGPRRGLHGARAHRRLRGRARGRRRRARPGADPPRQPETERAERVVSELLDLPPDRRPTAIFSANNRNTIGALHALAGRERRRRAGRLRRLRAGRPARHHGRARGRRAARRGGGEARVRAARRRRRARRSG